MSDSATPWNAAHQASLSFTISQSFLKLMSIESMMPSNHLILCFPFYDCCSVAQSCPTLCDPMNCSTPSPGAGSNSCPLSRWCHPTISSSVIPFSSCLQSFPASGSFLMSQLFISGGQSTGASALASVLPMNIQDWFPLELAGLISLRSKGLSRVFSNTTVQRHQFFNTQPSL